MSFFQETHQCGDYKKYYNTSGGSFGGGSPTHCPYCNILFTKENRKVITLNGWLANDDGSIKEGELLW